jgi:cyclic pyranopterin phosphate synthase
MPFENNGWSRNGFISYEEIKKIIENKYRLKEITNAKNLVAKDFSIEGYPGKVSFISSISNHFCDSCNRLRITSTGRMKLCLFSNGENELNFKEILNNKIYSDDDICNLIESSLQFKRKVHPAIEELINLEENSMLNIGG